MQLLGIDDPPAELSNAKLTLTGNHVRLVPLRTDHAAGLQPWVDLHEEGLQQALTTPHDFEDSAGKFFEWLIDRAGEGIIPFAVESADTGEFLGYTRYLHIEPLRRMTHIGGTWYVPAARGTVVNPECKLLLLEHAFTEASMNRVQIQTRTTNSRSQRAITRIGATFEGISRADYPLRDGSVRDTWVASVIRSEWPEVRSQLKSLIQRSQLLRSE